MLRNLLSLVAVGFLFQACTSSLPEINLQNELESARKDAPVVLSREFIQNKIGEIPAGKTPIVLNENAELIPCQVDDLDLDGQWDELSFVIDIEAKASRNISLKFVLNDSLPQFVARTNVRLGVGNKEIGFKGVNQAISPKGFVGIPLSYQAESVGWETDKMAFRNYFDCRNAKDLFGKLSPEMIMDKVGIVGNYHKLADWGMDVLHVGPSLGSGGLALMHKDSLYRLGNTEVFEFQLVSKGPVRSIFNLNYTGWNIDGELIDAQEQITVWAGRYCYQSDVTLKGFNGDKELVVGIVTSKLENNPAFRVDAQHSKYTLVGTHGTQSTIGNNLGLAILLPTSEVIRVGDAPEVSFTTKTKDFAALRLNQAVGETHYVTQGIKANVASRHYFYATWETENAKWANQTEFVSFLKQEALQISSPLVVK